VARRIWHPRLPIGTVAGWVPAGQKSAVGLVAFANSITLTPGTVALTVRDDRILVHALHAAGLADLEAGEMNRRVCRMEGHPR
jgi:multicomponent Na+:H+ antiporter subunit E